MLVILYCGAQLELVTLCSIIFSYFGLNVLLEENLQFIWSLVLCHALVVISNTPTQQLCTHAHICDHKSIMLQVHKGFKVWKLFFGNVNDYLREFYREKQMHMLVRWTHKSPLNSLVQYFNPFTTYTNISFMK